MAIYKFKITFEDYDEVCREIEIKSNQSFEDLHRAIHAAIGFDGKANSSFYMSNDQWHKGKEITLNESSIKDAAKTVLMEKSILKNFIIEKKKKIYYIFNLEKPWTFYIQLVKITVNEDPKLQYPLCTKTTGIAPKQFGNTPIIPTVANDDLDFLNEFGLGEEDEEEVDAMGIEAHPDEPSDEQEEEEPSEFDDVQDEDFNQEED
jgi:hypothetical protein